MPVRPVAFGFAAGTPLASGLGTGCSGGGSSEPEEAKSSSQNAEDVAYHHCLEKHGVVLEERSAVETCSADAGTDVVAG
ncbi:hypothetical protein [Streptomyces althioticus]|uniref:hypothetical protein n=1 Tax=Streptomyces althioticus TaxID=83380 RepID=UPI0033F2DCF0